MPKALRTFFQFIKKNKLYVILLALIAFGILPIIIISFFNHPSADDFSYAIKTHECVQNGGGLFQLMGAAAETSADFYNTWQGLYSAAFVLSLQPAIFGDGWYRIAAFIILAVELVGFLLIARAVTKHLLKSTSRLWPFVGVICWFFFIQMLPSPVQGIYWFNGAANYMFFWTMWMMTIAFSLSCTTHARKGYAVRLAIAAILAFVTAGGNHVTSFGCMCTLFALAVSSFSKRRNVSIFLPFLMCVIGFVIVMIAPGTEVRSDALGSKSPKRTLISAVYYLFMLVTKWMTVQYFLLILLLIPFLWDIVKKSSRQRAWFTNPVLWAIESLALMYAMLCVPLQSLGHIGTGRLTNSIFATFIVLSLVLCMLVLLRIRAFVFENSGDRLWREFFKLGSPACCVLVAVSLCAIMFSFNNAVAFKKSTWVTTYECLVNRSAQKYDEEMRLRESLLNDPQVSDVRLKAIKNRPKPLFRTDIKEGKGYWINKAMSEYYGKNSVALEK